VSTNTKVVVRGSGHFPALFVANSKARSRVRDFFTAHIRNPNTRRAYRNAALRFSEWCQAHGIGELAQVETIHVSAYIEEFSQSHSRPTVKQHLAALKMLFDWLVVGQVIPANPASIVRGPAHSQKKGKTPVLTPEEARELLDAIETDTLIGLRDRALIALLVYSFSRVGAAIKMRVEDFYTQGRRGWVRLHEYSGKQHEMPAHHNLDAYLESMWPPPALPRIAKGRCSAPCGARPVSSRGIPCSRGEDTKRNLEHAKVRRKSFGPGCEADGINPN